MNIPNTGGDMPVFLRMRFYYNYKSNLCQAFHKKNLISTIKNLIFLIPLTKTIFLLYYKISIQQLGVQLWKNFYIGCKEQ